MPCPFNRVPACHVVSCRVCLSSLAVTCHFASGQVSLVWSRRNMACRVTFSLVVSNKSHPGRSKRVRACPGPLVRPVMRVSHVKFRQVRSFQSFVSRRSSRVGSRPVVTCAVASCQVAVRWSCCVSHGMAGRVSSRWSCRVASCLVRPRRGESSWSRLVSSFPPGLSRRVSSGHVGPGLSWHCAVTSRRSGPVASSHGGSRLVGLDRSGPNSTCHSRRDCQVGLVSSVPVGSRHVIRVGLDL